MPMNNTVTFAARFPGRCGLCSQSIVVGQLIRPVTPRGYVHAACSDALRNGTFVPTGVGATISPMAGKPWVECMDEDGWDGEVEFALDALRRWMSVNPGMVTSVERDIERRWVAERDAMNAYIAGRSA